MCVFGIEFVYTSEAWVCVWGCLGVNLHTIASLVCVCKFVHTHCARVCVVRMTVINSINTAYRWMDQKVALRAAAAVDRGEALESEIYRQCLEKSNGREIFVGRVISETGEDLKDAKLPINTHSLLLEGCSGRSSGRTVRLFVSECIEYFVYAGQILGAIGRFGSSSEFHAETLVRSPDGQATHIHTGASLLLLVASGPYSPDSMLLFDSISELEVKVRQNPLDVLILMGPFLDITNPIIASGTVCDAFKRPVSFEDIYREEIFPKISRLARACETVKTRLVLVPSVNEARFDFPLPQPSFAVTSAPVWTTFVKELPSCVEFVSNPATITMGETCVLISSTDALSALNSNVLFKQSTVENSLGRVDECFAEFLRSKTLFPVSPCNLRIDPANASLLQITQSPSLVVFPAAGRRFVKSVHGCTFVNPGQMSDPSGTVSTVASIVIDAKIEAEILKI